MLSWLDQQQCWDRGSRVTIWFKALIKEKTSYKSRVYRADWKTAKLSKSSFLLNFSVMDRPRIFMIPSHGALAFHILLHVSFSHLCHTVGKEQISDLTRHTTLPSNNIILITRITNIRKYVSNHLRQASTDFSLPASHQDVSFICNCFSNAEAGHVCSTQGVLSKSTIDQYDNTEPPACFSDSPIRIRGHSTSSKRASPTCPWNQQCRRRLCGSSATTPDIRGWTD